MWASLCFSFYVVSRQIQYIHNLIEYIQGQRIIGFYDPSKHIIEAGEKKHVFVSAYLFSKHKRAKTDQIFVNVIIQNRNTHFIIVKQLEFLLF